MTRERKKETGGRTYSWKALRHSLTCSQNKGLYKYQRRANQLQTGASPHQRQRGRQVTEEPEARGNVGPRDGILHQTVRRLPVANQVFLGSWTVGIYQEGRSQRSAPQRRHMAHQRRCSRCAPGKLSSWDGGGDRTHSPPGAVRSPSSWLPELLGPGKGTKHRPSRVCAPVEYPRTWTWAA